MSGLKKAGEFRVRARVRVRVRVRVWINRLRSGFNSKSTRTQPDFELKLVDFLMTLLQSIDIHQVRYILYCFFEKLKMQINIDVTKFIYWYRK